MDEFAIKSSDVKTAAPTGFGVWLSLLAIGLTLSAVRGGATLVLIRPGIGDTSGGWIEFAVTVGVGLLSLIAPVLLLRRKRVFIPVMSALLVINLLLGFILYGLVMTSEVQLPNQGAVHVAMLGSTVIACLWLAYLWKSQHVRKVCVN